MRWECPRFPAVDRYGLIGYENRDVADEDFRNRDQMLCRFVDGRPVNVVRTEFLAWCV